MAKLSRRHFLKIAGSAASVGAARVLLPGLLGGVAACQPQAATLAIPASATLAATATQAATASATQAATMTPGLPATATLATPERLAIGARVMHLHSASATKWGGQVGYWEYVDQDVVTRMVERGVTELTDQATAADAWRTLIPAYQPGKGIAIKVNFNNTLGNDCGVAGGEINALPQPVAAVVAGLKAMGVDEGDIWIYDGVNRFIPAYFTAGVPFGGVQYFDKCHTPVDYFSSHDPTALVNFNPPSGVPALEAQRLADVPVRASYLINMPILKSHGCASITLGFKNHFGSIFNPGGIHSHVFPYPGCEGRV
ncbi:DUF362 domain-containing protein, partial [bacterium]